MVVDLPAPFRPTRATEVPAPTERSKPLTARTAPKSTKRPWTLRTGSTSFLRLADAQSRAGDTGARCRRLVAHTRTGHPLGAGSDRSDDVPDLLRATLCSMATA